MRPAVVLILTLFVLSSCEDLFCDVRTGSHEHGDWRVDNKCLSAVLDGFAKGEDIRDTLATLGFSERAIDWRNSCFSDVCNNIGCHDVKANYKPFIWKNSTVVLQKLISLCWNWHPRTCHLVRLGYSDADAPGVFGFPSLRSLAEEFGGICSVGDSLLQQFHQDLLGSGVSNAQFSLAWILVNAFNLRPMPPYELDKCKSENANITFNFHFFEPGRAGSLKPSDYNCLPDRMQRSDVPDQHNYLLHYQEWTRLLSQCKGLLILQTGHHWHSENSNGSLYPRMVESVLSYVSENFNGTVIYFPSFRGHTNCGSSGSPHGPMIDHVDKVRWSLPEALNHHWFDIGSRLHGLKDRFYVLNMTGSSILRPDAHRAIARDGTYECLHFCTPGLTHSWTELLYNFLLQLKRDAQT